MEKFNTPGIVQLEQVQLVRNKKIKIEMSLVANTQRLHLSTTYYTYYNAGYNWCRHPLFVIQSIENKILQLNVCYLNKDNTNNILYLRNFFATGSRTQNAYWRI